MASRKHLSNTPDELAPYLNLCLVYTYRHVDISSIVRLIMTESLLLAIINLVLRSPASE